MHLKFAHVSLVKWPKFENLSSTIREVKMNKVKANKAKKFSQFLRKWRHNEVNGQEKWDVDDPSQKLQTIWASPER